MLESLIENEILDIRDSSQWGEDSEREQTQRAVLEEFADKYEREHNDEG